MLHYQRKRQEDFARREAAGENVWTYEFSPEALTRLMESWKGIAGVGRRQYAENAFERVCESALALVARETGREFRRDVQQAELSLWIAIEDPYFAPSAIEAFIECGPSQWEAEEIAEMEFALNRILAEERIAYELVDGRMVEFDSKEMHQEVVAPTLRLLSGRVGWENVEAAYQNALKEIGADPSDAITDAGTALQEALTLLGCEGNALGPLLKSAKKKGLLAPHDETLSDAIGKIIDWVSADRSAKGDAHNAKPATRDDAWFAVHVVGALILRLVGDRRT